MSMAIPNENAVTMQFTRCFVISFDRVFHIIQSTVEADSIDPNDRTTLTLVFDFIVALQGLALT